MVNKINVGEKKVSIIEINQETCNKCGICAEECPRRVITLPDGGVMHPVYQVETN